MAESLETLRVALIGKTGAGKSALGNTILRRKAFKTAMTAESVTKTCETAYGNLPSGRRIKIVDTPGIMDTKGRDVRKEVTKAISHLSPGPHAFIIVLTPARATTEERQVIRELRDLFGDESFLEHTLIVMNRKNEIIDEDDEDIDIHEYIATMAVRDVQNLYNDCGKRIVAVENMKTSEEEKQKYASEIEDAIHSLGGGHFSHAYFLIRQMEKIHENEIKILERKIEEQARANNRSFCNIL